MNKDKDGRLEVPTMYDINGSSHFYNMADYGLTVHRRYEEETVEVHVQKVKFKHLGHNGLATFKYNIPNGRYVPYYGESNIAWNNDNMLVKKVKDAEAVADTEIEYEEYDTAVMANNDFYTQAEGPYPF